MIIPALCSVTIGGAPSSLRDYVALAERYGFGGVDISFESLISEAQNSSWSSVKAIFDVLGVAPSSGGLSVEWRKDDDTFNAGLTKLPEILKAGQEVGCSRVCTWIPPSVSEDPIAYRGNAVKRFRQIAIVMADHGMRLGLEFVGPETARVGPKAMGPNPFMWTLPQTMELIADINAPGDNVGLLVDSFHWFCTGSDLSEIENLDPKYVVHVHINDAPDRPLAQQIDFERLLPGEGVIDLAGFFGALKKIDYNGYAAVETFSADLKAMGNERAAAATGESIEQIQGMMM